MPNQAKQQEQISEKINIKPNNLPDAQRGQSATQNTRKTINMDAYNAYYNTNEAKH